LWLALAAAIYFIVYVSSPQIDHNLAVIPGVFFLVFFFVGVYSFTGRVRHSLTLTSDRLIHRQQSQYPGMDKKFVEKVMFLEDVYTSRVANALVDWLIVWFVIVFPIGTLVFTPLGDASSLVLLIMGIIVGIVLLRRLLRPTYRLHVEMRNNDTGFWCWCRSSRTVHITVGLADGLQMRDEILQACGRRRSSRNHTVVHLAHQQMGV
jgi:hypothetical protein